jgi:hypothetical protein
VSKPQQPHTVSSRISRVNRRNPEDEVQPHGLPLLIDRGQVVAFTKLTHEHEQREHNSFLKTRLIFLPHGRNNTGGRVWRHLNVGVEVFGERGCGNLLPSGAGLARSREQAIGPNALILRRLPFRARGCSAGIGDAVPVQRRFDDSPYISLVVQRHSDQERCRVLPQWQTIRNPAGSASAARQIAQEHGSFDRQSLRRANSAPLRTYYQGDTFRRERMPAVHAGDDQRNLHSQSCAAPRRFGSEYLHLRDYVSANLLV